ncbi:MAG: hypothetical protein M1321_00890 [Candidatus Marsarchaeota archaeon]|nr:hypothetical protein [Candidatus Marsarchaeota archaeon]
MTSKKKATILVSIVAIAIAVFVLAIYIVLSNALGGLHPIKTVNGTISVFSAVTKTGIATYNMSRVLDEFAKFRFEFYNVSSANITLSMFQKNPDFNVYIVNPGISCFNCFDYSSLYSDMYKDLDMYGINATTRVRSITLNQVNQTADNSLIVLSTGLFPATLLPETGLPRYPGTPNITVLNLLQRGDYIVYVGQNFSRAEFNGQIQLMRNQTLALLNTTGLWALSPTRNATRSTLFNFTNPTFGFHLGSLYGAINYTGVYNGTFIAFSNYPTMIWHNVGEAAWALSKAIALRFWMSRLATGSLSMNSMDIMENGSITLLTTNMSLNNTPDAANLINASYSMIQVNASNNATWLDRSITFRVPYNSNGTLSLPSLVGYGDLISGQVNINQVLSNRSFFINVSNRNLQYAYEVSLGAFSTAVPLIHFFKRFGDLPLDQYYIASLTDIYNRHYGYALFLVPLLEVNYTSANFQQGIFTFSVLSNGQPLSNSTFTASIDGQYNQTGTVTDGVINYTLPKGAIVKYGEHNIIIRVLNSIYVTPEYYPSPPSIPPLYIEMAIAGVVVLLLNLLLRAPNREDYFIDVSESPPPKQVEIGVPSDQIVNLFDTVNMRRYWKYMPLTPEEMKSGISANLRINNTPVSVTLQNTNEVLYELESKGLLSNIGDYYLPVRWEQASKHDAEYLVIFRKLRDHLVTHASLFTDLDQGEGADMILTSNGKQVPIYIFSRKGGMRRIRVEAGAKAFIVFINSEAMYEFTDRLYSTYGSTSEMLRIAIESGAVKLVETGNLEPMHY